MTHGIFLWVWQILGFNNISIKHIMIIAFFLISLFALSLFKMSLCFFIQNAEDEDAEWERFQKGLTKREKVLEGKSKTSHSVHCPLFPDDKQEFWWVYVCDRKNKKLMTVPYHLTNLVEEEEVQLKMTAPHRPAVYTFQVLS